MVDSRVGPRVLAVLLLGLSVRLLYGRFFYLTGDTVSDYYPAVLQLVYGFEAPYPVWEQWHARLALLLPLSLFQTLTDDALIAVPCAVLPFSLFQTYLVYRIATTLWDETAGLAAAVLDALHPLSVIWGTQGVPDPINSCLCTAAIYCFVRRGRETSTVDLFAAGLCIGVAYMAKISGLFTLAILLGFCLLQRRQGALRALAVVVGGTASVLVAETVILSVLGQELIFRPLSLMGENVVFQARIPITWQRYLPGFFGSQLWPLDAGFPYHGLYGPATIVAAAWVLARRHTIAALTVSWWWLGLLLLANFAGLGFDNPLYKKLQMRGIMFAAPAACILLGWAFTRLRRPARNAGLATMALSSLLFIHVVYATFAPFNDGYRFMLHEVDEVQTGKTIYFHDSASMQRVDRVLLGTAICTQASEASQLANASPGDLAVLFISGYTPEESLPRFYLATLSTPAWDIIATWNSKPGLVSGVLDYLDIRLKKGNTVKVQVLRRNSDQSIANAEPRNARQAAATAFHSPRGEG